MNTEQRDIAKARAKVKRAEAEVNARLAEANTNARLAGGRTVMLALANLDNAKLNLARISTGTSAGISANANTRLAGSETVPVTNFADAKLAIAEAVAEARLAEANAKLAEADARRAQAAANARLAEVNTNARLAEASEFLQQHKVQRPPGSLMLRLAEILISKKKYERDCKAALADWHEEYFEALDQKRGKAKMASIRIRHTWAFCKATGWLFGLETVGKLVAKFFDKDQ